MTVRLIFFFLVVGCAAALPHGRLEPRPIELYPTRGTSEAVTAACEPLTEAPLVRSLFGEDLVARGVLPIMVVVRNDSSNSVVVRDQDIQLETPGRPESTENREQLERTGLSPGRAAVWLAKGVIGAGVIGAVIMIPFARAEHAQAEYNLQNRVSEVALRSATLSSGESTSGVVYFPIDRSWLADAPTSLVVRAQQLDPRASLVIRIPLGGLAQPVMRGMTR